MKNEVIEILCGKKGKYRGSGKNHYDENFIAEMEIKPIVGNCGVILDFIAENDKDVYHEEHSIITLNWKNELFLWSLCSSMDNMLELEFRSHEKSDFIKDMITFGFGLPQDKSSYRQEIAIILWYDDDVEYVYSWGMPGDEFRIRSNVRMSRDI